MNDDRVEDREQPWQVTIVAQELTEHATVIRVTGEVLGVGAAALRRSLQDALRRSPELLIVDLSGVADIASDGIDVLHWAAGSAAQEDTGFCLVDTPDGALRAGLDGHRSAEAFEIFSSVTDAMRDPP